MDGYGTEKGLGENGDKYIDEGSVRKVMGFK